jgi:hypothetical protein
MKPRIEIKPVDPCLPEVLAMISELDTLMRALYPIDSASGGCCQPVLWCAGGWPDPRLWRLPGEPAGLWRG